MNKNETFHLIYKYPDLVYLADLLSQSGQITCMLSDIPEEDAIDRISFQNRLDAIWEDIREIINVHQGYKK